MRLLLSHAVAVKMPKQFNTVAASRCGCSPWTPLAQEHLPHCNNTLREDLADSQSQITTHLIESPPGIHRTPAVCAMPVRHCQRNAPILP